MSVYELPPGLPVPDDDGACDHLVGLRLPDRLSEPGLLVVYLYPWIGESLFSYRESRRPHTKPVQIGPLDTDDTIYLHNAIAGRMGIQT